jgi:hypothetical protein
MELRPELTPPTLDEALVARLARLADRLDGPREHSELLAEFNQLAGSALPRDDFRGIHKVEDPEDFARRVLYQQAIRPVPDIIRAELVEVVRRAMAADPGDEAYFVVLEANEPTGRAYHYVYWPPDYDESTGTWGGGRPMSEYAPTPEQIVEWALASGGGSPDAEPGAADVTMNVKPRPRDDGR